ncbi:MAG: stage II sporulation protein R [Clostridia bacterium]|nr:stage II sporulation protein R [Clostridia bacterium]
MKKIILFCTLTLCVILILPFLPLSGEGRVYTDTIRLHVLANSDGEEDQELKLKVRDAVIERVADITEYVSSRTEAEEVINQSLAEIESLGLEVIAAEGFDYTVKATLGEEYYPERSYDGIRLPEGRYLSLRVIIGSGEGQNWWCILYPPLCTSASEPEEELVQAGFTGEQIRLLCEDENPKYVVRFRILEFFHNLFG